MVASVVSPVVQAFEDQAGPAGRLAQALGVPFRPVALHRFPDGEWLPTVVPTAGTVIAHVSLDRPNETLMALLLACDAWRRAGARRLVLVAPYLCYMRQDRIFEPGQSLSRDVVGALLGPRFDRILTVDAHLHRTRSLAEVFGSTPAEDLSAAAPLAAALAEGRPSVVLGPDQESRPWAGRIAKALGADLRVATKTRTGDRAVAVDIGSPDAFRGRNVAVVDDICSSGGTLWQAVSRLREAGAARIEIGVVHALFDPAVEARLRAAGADRIVSTTSVVHPTNAADLSGLLAQALEDEIAP